MRPAGRAVAAVAAIVAVFASLWYVQAPPRTQGDYRERAAITAQSLRSQVQTAELWVRELEQERVTLQAATVALREAEGDAVAAASELAVWDPRGDTRPLRSELTMLANAVTDALAELRIAAEGGRWDMLRRSTGRCRGSPSASTRSRAGRIREQALRVHARDAVRDRRSSSAQARSSPAGG